MFSVRCFFLACLCVAFSGTGAIGAETSHGPTQATKPDGPSTIVFAGESVAPSSPLALWYRRPANRWLDALPLGNGRLGTMIFGGVTTETVALNESTFWSGQPDASHNNPEAREHLAEIRGLLFAGEFRKAVKLIEQHVLGRTGNYGTHLPVGDLVLQIQHGGSEVRDYRRELDLKNATARVSYSVAGVKYSREAIVSHPDNVIALRLGADKPGKVSFEMRFRGNDAGAVVSAEKDGTLWIAEDAREKKHSDGKSGVSLKGVVRVIADGGSVVTRSDAVIVTGANTATLLVALNTTFGGADPRAISERQIAKAAGRSFSALRERHIADYRPLFERVALDLGGKGGALIPTDQRMTKLRQGADDPELTTLFFQYGRYLLIAGSRGDSPLPTNLQGIWNDNLACNMGWTCDFHLDINTQQNYWPAEVCNLAECHEPLFKLIESLRVPGRKTAEVVYGARGWVCHVFTNPWGFTAPGWGLGWGVHPTGGIWLASHLWEHYRFTGDARFLREQAYPVLKEAAEFFLDYMVQDPVHGWLVTGPSTSPENAFVTPNGQGSCSEYMGPTCDTVLVGQLFASCIEASRVLNLDEAFRTRLEAAAAKLPPLRVGKNGQLMEWLEDFDEAIPNHRHTTHLLALYPFANIVPRITPELAAAARMTLHRRLSQKDWEDVEWSRGNLIAFYARLGDGDAAHKHVLGLLREDTDADLLTFSRGGIAGAPENIFCVDGNSAGTAGIAEMLVQSHAGCIELLPALPKAWPDGSVRGLRARGGFTVDMAWRGGRVTKYRVVSGHHREVDVRVNGNVVRRKT